jgi:uncharacterized protein YjaZ
MEIIVRDTITELQPLFTESSRPQERLQRFLELINSTEESAGKIRARLRRGYEVVEAAQLDGFDVVFAQQGWGLFNPTRKREASAWVFEQLSAHDVLGKADRWLRQFAGRFGARSLPPRMELMILPTDPANRSLMIDSHGLQAFGGSEEAILVQIWPSAGNLERLGPVLARAFAHNVRWHHTPPNRPPALADYLLLEGLAASFVAVEFPDLAVAPWLVSFYEPDDWEEALRFVAGFYGLSNFNEITYNVYGMTRAMGSERPPYALPLEAEELPYAREIIYEALEESAPSRIAAYLYGDEIVAAHGHAAMGLSPYAGFEVGYRLAQSYLQRTGQNVAEAIATPTEVILRELE